MERWCERTDEEVVENGDYLEARVVTISGRGLHEEEEFVQELAARVMASYENQPSADFVALRNEEPVDTPERTKWFYRRLFEDEGEPTQEFQTWASETLAAWVEECFEDVEFVDRSGPHKNDPVYDVLCRLDRDDGDVVVRIVQVKSTRDNLAANCNHALTRFESLENGEHDPELIDRLTLMQLKGGLPEDFVPREILFDVDARQYRVTAMHEEDRDALTIMTTYDEKVVGDTVRRSARLIRITNWNEFWLVLGACVYAQLA